MLTNNRKLQNIAGSCSILRPFSGHHICLGLLLILCLLFSAAQVAGAAEQTPPETGAAENKQVPNRNEILDQILGGQDFYFYHRENRPDPPRPVQPLRRRAATALRDAPGGGGGASPRRPA